MTRGLPVKRRKLLRATTRGIVFPGTACHSHPATRRIRGKMKIITVILSMGLMLNTGLLLTWLDSPAKAHHTLGVNQAGKATESPQIPIDHEIQADGILFQVTVMPSHPVPGQLTRVIAHAKRLPSMAAYQGEMRFRIRETFWFRSGATILDQTRLPTDGRYVQSVQFPNNGAHSILLEIKSAGRSHRVEVPLTVGEPGGTWKALLGLLAALAFGWIAWRAARNRRRPRLV